MSKILIFGVTGQDGSLLADDLLKQGHDIWGVARRTSTPNDRNIKQALVSPNFHLVSGDITDFASVLSIVSSVQPTELYLLAAQSHVGESFKSPLSTWDITAKGVLNVLEAVKQSSPNTRVVFAASSEMYGNNRGPDGYISEHTSFNPQSPYAIAKCAGYYAVQLYRSYGLFCSNCIAFNHESPRRGETFVTRKITKYVGNNIHSIRKKEPPASKLKLGNLSAYRDWSHAHDIIKGMQLIARHEEADDFILSSGESHTVEEFLIMVFAQYDVDYRNYVEIDQELFRPAEVHKLLGNSGKARTKLAWYPSYNFHGLVSDMLKHDVTEDVPVNLIISSKENPWSFLGPGDAIAHGYVEANPQPHPLSKFHPYSD